jgi:hypothetical protein
MDEDPSFYDDEASIFGDNASVDDSEAGSLIGAREDVKLMNVLRAIVILILLTIAFISAETVFVIATISDQDSFRNAYTQAAEQLTEGFLADIQEKLLTAGSFSTELSSSATVTNQSWPNVSFYDFDVRSAGPLRMSKSSVISISPFVLADESGAWESYATAEYYSSATSTERSLSVDTPHFVNVSAGVSYYPTSRVVSEGIYKFSGVNAIDQDAKYSYSFPIWQMFPTFGNSSTGLIGTLFDQASNRVREQALDLMFLRGGCSMSTFLFQDTNGTDYANYTLPRSMISYPVFKSLSSASVFTPTEPSAAPGGDIGASLNLEFRWEPVLSGILVDYSAPLTVVVQNECGEEFTYTVTGMKATFVGQGAIYDKTVDGYSPVNTSYEAFEAVLAAHGGIAMEGETVCSYKLDVYATKPFKQEYLDGQDPGLYKGIVLGFFIILVLIFIAFDCMIDRSTKHGKHKIRYLGSFGSSGRPPFKGLGLFRSLLLQPWLCEAGSSSVAVSSNAFSSFSSNTAVIQAAERSDKIVRSLFPEAIRDRLYEDAIRKEQQNRGEKTAWKADGTTVVAAKHKLKNLLDEENPVSDEIEHHDSDPIADYFPNCTSQGRESARVGRPSEYLTLVNRCSFHDRHNSLRGPRRVHCLVQRARASPGFHSSRANLRSYGQGGKEVESF